MVQGSPKPVPASLLLASGFASMFSIGAMYSLSTLQAELPRLLGISRPLSYTPFAMVSLGLCVGLGSSASLISAYGARWAVGAGTIIWGIALLAMGHFLARSQLQGILLSGCLGGVGVGWTYPSVVLMISQGLPNSPLLGRAIGPVGFSSGSAASIAIFFNFKVNTLDPLNFGRCLQVLGITIVLVGASTIAGLGSYSAEDGSAAQSQSQPGAPPTWGLMGLTFLNTFPGMALFATLLPRSSISAVVDGPGPFIYIPCSFIALASGGIVWPILVSRFGANLVLTTIFTLRGALLVGYAMFPRPLLGVITASTICFGHGMGFSVLPVIIKSMSSDKGIFLHLYTRVLIAWGAAGTMAAIFDAVCVSFAGDLILASLMIGLGLLCVAVYNSWLLRSGVYDTTGFTSSLASGVYKTQR